jgi:hypothetical protein
MIKKYNDFINVSINEQYYDYSQDRKFKVPVRLNNDDEPYRIVARQLDDLQRAEI